MASFKISKMHQDGTVEASVSFATICNDDGSQHQVPMVARLIPVARGGNGWGLKTADDKLIYGPSNGQYYAHRNSELVEIDVSQDARFSRRA